MHSAIVLLVCQSGCEQIVIESMRRIPEVVEASFVFGGYDIIAKVAADKIEKLKDIVSWKIKRLDGVKSSLTLLKVDSCY